MDFSLTEEQKMLQATVRKFVKEQIIPLESEILRRPYTITQNRMEFIGPENYRRLELLGKELGLWALWVPTEYGGAGLGLIEYLMVSIELNFTFILFEFGGETPPVELISASPESDNIKERYVLPCVRDEKRFISHGIAQTEPQAGSDAAAIETRAIRQGNNWVLNGRKVFISEADASDFLIVPAVTDKGKGTYGITMFIVDRGTDKRPGYKVERIIPCMGGLPICPCELALDDLVVPGENVLGPVNDGFIVAQRFLETRGRLHHSGWLLGMAERAITMATEYAKKRITFGKPLMNRQAIQWMIADSAIDIHAARWMAYYCAWKGDRGENIRQEAAISKVFSDEMGGRVIDRAIQIYGALGTSMDLPLERMWRMARVLRIGGGSTEIMRWLIARNIFQGHASFKET